MSSRIVILGGGFGGAYCAQALAPLVRSGRADVLLIDSNDFFAFYPLLVEAGTGSLEPRHAVVSIRSFLRGVEFRMATVVHVDIENRFVCYRIVEAGIEDTVYFDHLVVALGSVTRWPEVPGLDAFGFELKNLADAVALRDRAITLLEAADATEDDALRRRLLHFVVVGGSLTGVEVAGEFDMFLKSASRHFRHVGEEDCRVTLVEIAPRILGALDDELARYATDSMRARGIDVRLETTVTRIKREWVELDGGERLDAQTVIWCAGIEPNPLIATLGVPVDERGYVRCAPDLRIEGHDRVWAIGDCAVNRAPDGQPYPATAQHALQMGRFLAKNLAAVLDGGQPRPFVYHSKGTLAALGCRTGVAKVFGMKISGFPAWFLWRTVYLMKMPGWWRKARVAADWSMDLVFPREFVQLGVHRVR